MRIGDDLLVPLNRGGLSAKRGDTDSAPLVSWRFEFSELAISFGKNGMCLSQSLGFEISETGEAIKDGLNTLHHELAPELFPIRSCCSQLGSRDELSESG